MANWSPLREALRDVSDRRTFSWEELDALVGGLPPSAYVHSAFWRGDRSGWRGFTAVDAQVGQAVTFVRQSRAEDVTAHGDRPPTSARSTGAVSRADVLLVGCAKSKLDHRAPARDLYVSDLFRKQREYAEATGVPWFILSAAHGLVAPADMLEPYDLYLPKTSQAYRQEWARRVVRRILAEFGSLRGLTVEAHAGATYTNPIRPGLQEEGAEVFEPLRGLPFGQRLAWYLKSSTVASELESRPPRVDDLVALLAARAHAETPAEFLASLGEGRRVPGLYSWWVDSPGAVELSEGLGHAITPGLIYAGLAGATRSRSGRKSSNTLWGRIKGMHLGGKHEFSTFRRSLGSILANARHSAGIDEDHVTRWMHQRLRVTTVPVADADALDGLETAVLTQLDPPLNLAKMAPTPIRARLSELRRQYGGGRKPD